jgi:CDGSH-type Zn-finger protein
MSGVPEIGGRRPLPINVVAGESYWWCACGRSRTQPFCDGSHKGSEFRPQEWEAPDTEEVWFCACKRSSHQPLCDGSHKTLP